MPESDDVLVLNDAPDSAVPSWATDEILSPIVIPSEHMESIRDRWMQPLVDRIAALEREVGRLETRHLQARREADAATYERDEAKRALADVAVERDHLRSERDALLAIRAKLRDQVKSLEYKVRSAQDTTALQAIDAYAIPRQRSLRRQPDTRRRRHRWWPFGKRS
jgi:chromosome segregation ATPase